MPNYTIYVSASNDSQFKEESNKSGLVNELLEDYYESEVRSEGFPANTIALEISRSDAARVKKQSSNTVELKDPIKPIVAPDLPVSVAEDFKYRRTPPDIAQSLKTASPAVNLCKVHGIPLTTMGKCLMKGCKYA